MTRMTVKTLSDRLELLDIGLNLYVDTTRRAYNNGNKYMICDSARPILWSNSLQELSDSLDEWLPKPVQEYPDEKPEINMDVVHAPLKDVLEFQNIDYERSHVTEKITENFEYSEFEKVADLLVLDVNLATATTEELKKIYGLLLYERYVFPKSAQYAIARINHVYETSPHRFDVKQSDKYSIRGVLDYSLEVAVTLINNEDVNKIQKIYSDFYTDWISNYC